ncbi:MAG: NUDIX domain-containing protein [Candidatus Woesearchaeota archaeon]
MDTMHRIYGLFLKSKRLRFSDIEKALGIKTNVLAYHLNNMAKKGMLQKEDDEYMLTAHGEKLLPFFAHITQQLTGGCLPVVLAAIIKDNQILLLKRKRRPYQGYWGLPGGKLHLEESIEECAVREVKEETGLECKFSHIAAIVHERVKENSVFKHAFLLFFVLLKPMKGEVKESEEGTLEWFPLKTLQPGRIIPSDYHMIKKHLKEKTRINCVIMEEKEERLIKYEQTKI